MILMDGRRDNRMFRFPESFSLVLPDECAADFRAPLVMLLHDLGSNRDQWTYGANQDALTEKHHMAFLIPDGRRSCFLDMQEGPAWNRYLRDELWDDISSQFNVDGTVRRVIGIGTGALGAISLASEGRFDAVALEPDVGSVTAPLPERWPRQQEWIGVFGASGEKWLSSVAGSTGLLIAEQPIAKEILELGSWKKVKPEGKTIGRMLEQALRYLSGDSEEVGV